MAIEPFINCSDISKSIEFYTKILDFVIVRPPNTDPESYMSKYSLIERDGCLVHLSSHSGDGVVGNVVYIRVDNIDSLYLEFVANGLNTDDPDKYPSLRMQPIEQSWGMKEFSVTDPDGNKLTYGHQLS